jgi:hypothetical protein
VLGVLLSGFAKDLGEVMAQLGTLDHFLNLNPRGNFLRKSVKSSIFTLFGAKFSGSQPASPPPILNPETDLPILNPETHFCGLRVG